MPNKRESIAPSERAKTTESAEQIQQPAERSPADEKALIVRRRANRLIDQYEMSRSKYELELLSQKTVKEPTQKQKELKKELQELWDELQDMEGEITEHEYMAESEDIKTSMGLARQEITNLPRFTGQERPPQKREQPAQERATKQQLKSRESIKLNAKERIRSNAEIKEMRVRLAKLKSAFAGAYKISPARAQILISQPTGLLGALKGLSEGKMPSREERKKLSAIRTEDATEQLQDIQKLEEKIKKEWKEAKKAEALADTPNQSAIDEIPLDQTVSPKTLRESFDEEIDVAKANGDNKRASEILTELNELKANLHKHFPELLRADEVAEKVDDKEPETIKEIKQTTHKPPKARQEKSEPSIILPPEERAIRETPQILERHRQIEATIQAFGGGEAGRKYAADLWDYANSVIKEKGKIDGITDALEYVNLFAEKVSESRAILGAEYAADLWNKVDKVVQEKGKIRLEGTKDTYKDTIGYIHAFAKRVQKSAETLGQERSAALWQDIQDQKATLLASESLKKAERKKLEEIDPLSYVLETATRDKALKEDDLDAAGKHNNKIDEMNSLLGFPDGMNPSTGEGMGKTPRKETRALGKNRARTELSRTTEKMTGMGTRAYEAGQGKRERIAEEPFTIEWATQLLPNARAEWNAANDLIKTNSRQAKKIINEEIKDIVSSIEGVIDDGADVGDEYLGIKKLPSLRIGSPQEATRYVMLKALSEIAPQKDIDKTIQQRLVDSISEIDRKLADIQGPEAKASSTELTDSVREAVQAEGTDIEVREATANEAYLAKEAAEEATKLERLDKLTEKEISDLAGKIDKKRHKNRPMPRDFHDHVVNELRKFYTALDDNHRKMANLSMGRLTKYLRDKMSNANLNKVRDMLREAKEEFLEKAA